MHPDPRGNRTVIARPRCAECKFSCKQCIALPPATAHLPLSVGSMEEVQSRAHYQTYLENSTFCLVLRGDHENSRRFSEAILAGCVPVLIADMPAWPFARRLDYKKFSYEFSWAGASISLRLIGWIGLIRLIRSSRLIASLSLDQLDQSDRLDSADW